MKKKHHARLIAGSLAALGLSGQAFGATFTLTPNDGSVAQDWNSAATWGGVNFPGSSAADIANATGNFLNANQTINVSANLANPLGSLVLGDTGATPASTTIGSTGGSLSFAANGFINSAGTTGAVNSISAPIVLGGSFAVGTATGPATVANNGLTISGKITPSAAGNRNVDNVSGRTVSFGDIDLSTGATASTMTIRAGTTGAAFVNSNIILNGTIANGSSVASNLVLGARASTPAIGYSTFQINGTNTYTGTTSIGTQANTDTVIKINSDQPFGDAAGGTLTIGASGYVTSLEALNSDRTITKGSVTINRSIRFQGSNSVEIAAPTINMSNSPSTANAAIGALGMFNNDITAAGKTVTIGTDGGVLNLNGSNTTDLFRMRDVAGAGTTLIKSNIADNSGVVPTASRMTVKQNGTGTLILSGENTFQGGARISSTGTLQLGNGGTTGSLLSGNGLTPVVNGTAAGKLVFDRTDSYSSNISANGPVSIAQNGSGSVTLNNSQFHTGNTTVGDGTSASKLIVNGGLVAQSSTTTNATISAFANGQLQVRNVTLGGADTVASLGIKPGQPVWVTSGGASSLNYVDAILGANSFSVFGETSSLLAGGSAALTFGAGSALGTSASTTTVNSLATLGGAGTIAGAVNVLPAGRIAPGATAGAAGTLSTGAMDLNLSALDFDLADLASGLSDKIDLGSAGLNFHKLTFSFTAITSGVFEMNQTYDLVVGTGSFTGDVTTILTAFDPSSTGVYIANYSLTNEAGTNILGVTFTPIPEPSTYAAIAGAAALVGCVLRRRKSRG